MKKYKLISMNDNYNCVYFSNIKDNQEFSIIFDENKRGFKDGLKGFFVGTDTGLIHDDFFSILNDLEIEYDGLFCMFNELCSIVYFKNGYINLTMKYAFFDNFYYNFDRDLKINILSNCIDDDNILMDYQVTKIDLNECLEYTLKLIKDLNNERLSYEDCLISDDKTNEYFLDILKKVNKKYGLNLIDNENYLIEFFGYDKFLKIRDTEQNLK